MRFTLSNKKTNLLSLMSVTNKLIFANIILYVISLFVLLSLGAESFTKVFALTPSLILSGQAIWTFATSMFSHVLFFHIFANMFSLFFIGNFLEKIIGWKRFLSVYLIAGLVGGLFFVLSGLIFNKLGISGIGASGAIFGILGVLAVLVPYSKIYLIIGPLILILGEVVLSPFVPASILPTFNLLVNLFLFFMIFAIFSFNSSIRRFAVPVELPMWLLPVVAIVPLVILGFFVDLPIGNSAHIGGLFVGLIYGFYLRKKFPNKVKKISNHFK